MPNEKKLPDGIILDAESCLYLPDSGALVISDLHIGYEASLRAEGVAMPDFQFDEMMENLGQCVGKYQPSQLIINGDIKHEFSRNRGQEWDEVFKLMDFIAEKGIVIRFIRGNHDNYLKTIIGRHDIELADYYLFDGILISHGHAPVSVPGGTSDRPFKIFGHEHPILRLRDEIGARLSMPCFLYDKKNKFILMPAFSPLASGTNVISPNRNFMIEELRGLDVTEARIFAIGENELLDFGKVGDHAGEFDDF